MYTAASQRQRPPPFLAPLLASDTPQDPAQLKVEDEQEEEEEEELTPEALALFWKNEKGLPKERIRYLIRAAEEHPQLRYPRTVLQPCLAALAHAFPDVAINELVSRFPPLLLLPPGELTHRVAFIHKTLYDLPPRFLATRAAPLLYLTPNEIQARLNTWQTLLPGSDAARVCRKAIPLLLRTEAQASSSVTSSLSLLHAHFNISSTAATKILGSVPSLLLASLPSSPSSIPLLTPLPPSSIGACRSHICDTQNLPSVNCCSKAKDR